MFHDCPVRRFTILESELHIETDEFSIGPGEKMLPARIFISGIEEIRRNGEKIKAFSVESGDAEIYGLEASENGVELILIWDTWAPKHSSDFAVYLFDGGTLKIAPDL